MTDQRRQARLQIEGKTIVELESSTVDQSEPSRLLTCKSLDISRGGVCAELAEAIPVGAILQFAVSLPSHGGEIFLVGEVKWCRPEGDHYLAGFEVLNAEGSDIENWIALIQSLES